MLVSFASTGINAKHNLKNEKHLPYKTYVQNLAHFAIFDDTSQPCQHKITVCQFLASYI